MTYKIENFFAEGLPNASGAYNGFPEYNFVGGHNSEKNIPVKELVKSAESYYGDSMKTEVPYTPYF